jgi:hypothetical protein
VQYHDVLALFGVENPANFFNQFPLRIGRLLGLEGFFGRGFPDLFGGGGGRSRALRAGFRAADFVGAGSLFSSV